MKYQVEEISKKIRKEKIVKKTIKTIILIFLFLLFCINAIMLYQKQKNPDEIPNICGISVFNIVSGSMEPNININDMVVIKKVSPKEINVGDIVTFKNKDGIIETHRVVWITEDEGVNDKQNHTTNERVNEKQEQIENEGIDERKNAQTDTKTEYKTKGDNNQIEDSGLISYEDIYGKYLFRIPKMGNFVEELQKNDGLISIMIIVIIVIILKNKKEKRKEKRKIEREKYDIKEKREHYGER